MSFRKKSSKSWRRDYGNSPAGKKFGLIILNRARRKRIFPKVIENELLPLLRYRKNLCSRMLHKLKIALDHNLERWRNDQVDGSHVLAMPESGSSASQGLNQGLARLLYFKLSKPNKSRVRQNLRLNISIANIIQNAESPSSPAR